MKSTTPYSLKWLDSVTVEFDPDNNFCFKKGSLWIELADVQRLLLASSERGDITIGSDTQDRPAIANIKYTDDKQFDKQQKSWEWPINTVGRLIDNLKTLPPEMPFYTAYFVEINGERVAKTIYPSLSRETVYGGRIQKFSPDSTSLVMWASQEDQSAKKEGLK